MSALYALVGFIVAQRLAELAYSARNERRLKARGACAAGAGRHPVLGAL